MTAFHAIVYLVMKLAIPTAVLAVAVFVLLKLVRRRQGLGDDSCPADAPYGSRTSRIVETLVLFATGSALAALIVMQDQWTRFLFGPNTDARAISIVNVFVTILAAGGFIAAIAFAWRGLGSAAVVVLAVTLFAYTVAVNVAARPAWRMSSRPASIRPTYADIDMVLDIGGCNVTGAELSANGVPLGKTPIHVKLSEFLAKVPDWKKAPGPTWATGSATAGDDSVARAMPRDLTWGTMYLPEVDHVNLAEPLEKAIRERTGRYIYLQAKYDGELGERTGSSGGGGGGDTIQYYVNFRFPKREAAIDRLLDQARLNDYEVDDEWLEAAAAFGPDAWIAIRQAIVNEPEMQQVLDAWVAREYQVSESRGSVDAWSDFERVMKEADERGEYFTGSPAGRAVELLWRRISPRLLVNEALPRIDSTTNISTVTYPDAAGGPQMAFYTPGTRRLQLPWKGRGSGVYRGRTGGREFPPSGGVLAHAIWSANTSAVQSEELGDAPTFFQFTLVPPLLRAEVAGRGPLAIPAALALGGSELEKFLVRKYEWTNRPGEMLSSNDREPLAGGEDVNRWLLAAARMPGAPGRRFRGLHREELFAAADKLAQHLFSRDDVAQQLDFLFVENDRDLKNIAMEYWPRYRNVVQNSRAPQALQLQVAYLIAAEPASTVKQYLDVWMNADARSGNDYQEAAEQAKQLRQLPVDKRALVLDALLAHYTAKRGDKPLPYDDYILRQLRELRFDEIDDLPSVAYQLQTLRDGPPEGATREWQIERFMKLLTANPAAKPLLVEALAKAQDPEYRLLALEALRMAPLPRFQKLLPPLLADPDEKVRAAAEGVTKDWESLRGSPPAS